MNLVQHSFLLYRVNQVYKDVKKRSQHNTDTEEHMPVENLTQVQHIASNIFKQVCFHINRNVKNLDIQAVQSALNTISQGTDLDKSELTKEYLIGVKDTGDILIDIENKTFFDIENNQWKNIPSDNNPKGI